MRALLYRVTQTILISLTLTSASDFFTFVVVQSSRRGLAEMHQTIHPHLIAISKEPMSRVGSRAVAAGNKQSNITSSNHVGGKTSYPGRQTRRQSWYYYHCEYGLFLFDGDIKAADLISYEASSTQKTQDDNVKGFSCYHWGNSKTLTDADKEP